MKKKRITNILLVLILLAGLSLLLYPSVSDYWNSLHQTQAIVDYAQSVADISNEKYAEMLDSAIAYNSAVAERGVLWELSEEQTEEYKQQLDINGTGIMGYIEIKKINCFLPVYHSTEEKVLQIAIGHISGSSLPVGGESSHCILSGHRGLPSARLFTDLDKLQIGDTFVLRTLDEILTYEVDQIRIVLPYELDDLRLEEGKDYCTLVTCTPYGVNSHRLLARGHRVENAVEAKEIRVTGDALQVEPILVAPVLAAPILLVLLVMVFTSGSRRKWQRKEEAKKQ